MSASSSFILSCWDRSKPSPVVSLSSSLAVSSFPCSLYTTLRFFRVEETVGLRVGVCVGVCVCVCVWGGDRLLMFVP